MARIIRSRPAPSPWWSTLIAGVAVGAVAAWLVLRGSGDEETLQPSGRTRPRRAVREPDVERLIAMLREIPGAAELRLRSLGGGILELVGTAGAELDVAALLSALAAEPRVSVVVNRVWPPDPSAPTHAAP